MKVNAISLNAEIPMNAAGVETRSTDNGKGLPANPFVGLRPFESDESFLFFGRDQQILALVQQLQSKHFLAVVGSSGCGKSSLIRAGLIPKLKAGFLVERRDHWRVAIMKPGESPLTNLSKALLEVTSQSPSADDVAALVAELRISGAQPVSRILNEPLKRAEANLLLVVDQFEELFRYDHLPVRAVESGEDEVVIELSNDEIQRAQSAKRELRRNEAANFVSIILEVARQRDLPIYVVMTMRSDFLGDCDAFHGLPETINETVYLVPRLNRQQRMEAIEKPIRLYGQGITSRLLDLVTNDVGDESDQLPVMQHALMRTWEKWKDQEPTYRPIDLPDYEAAAMISGALSKDAEIALSELGEDERVIAKRMFQALVETDAQGRNVRRPANLTQLAGIAGVTPAKVLEVIDHFRCDGRCFLTLTSERVEDDPLVDISHESFIRQWDQLGKWVKSENYSKDQYTRLAAAALRHSIDKGNLLSGTDLQLAIDWWESRKPNEAWSLRYNRDFCLAEKFLGESKTQSEAQQAELEVRRLKELESARIRQQNTKLRRLMYALGIISLIVLLGMGVTASSLVVAWRANTKANTQQQIATQKADEADKARKEALALADFAESESRKASEAATLANARLEDVQEAQAALKREKDRNERELNKQRKDLIDTLGQNYLRALSLAASSQTIDQAVESYEKILKVYDGEDSRGGKLATLLVLGRLFEGSLNAEGKDADRALKYYDASLNYFDLNDAAQKAKKGSTLFRMSALLVTEKRIDEASQRVEEAIGMNYQPTLDEMRLVYRSLADSFEALPLNLGLPKARRYYQLELAHLNLRMRNAPRSTQLATSKLGILIKLGTINTRGGDRMTASQRYEEAIDLATGSLLDMPEVEPLVRIAASLDRSNEKAQRNEFLQKAVDSVFTEKPAEAFRQVGDALYSSQQYQDAIEYWKRAERVYGAQDSNLPPTLRSIASAYERLGDKENALAYYRRALTLYESASKSPTTATSLRARIQQLSEKN